MMKLAESINERLSNEADDKEYVIVNRSIDRSRKLYDADKNMRGCEDIIRLTPGYPFV